MFIPCILFIPFYCRAYEICLTLLDIMCMTIGTPKTINFPYVPRAFTLSVIYVYNPLVLNNICKSMASRVFEKVFGGDSWTFSFSVAHNVGGFY